MALANCVKLENIEKQAEELQQQAGVFKRNATDLKVSTSFESGYFPCFLVFVDHN